MVVCNALRQAWTGPMGFPKPALAASPSTRKCRAGSYLKEGRKSEAYYGHLFTPSGCSCLMRAYNTCHCPPQRHSLHQVEPLNLFLLYPFLAGHPCWDPCSAPGWCSCLWATSVTAFPTATAQTNPMSPTIAT